MVCCSNCAICIVFCAHLSKTYVFTSRTFWFLSTERMRLQVSFPPVTAKPARRPVVERRYSVVLWMVKDKRGKSPLLSFCVNVFIGFKEKTRNIKNFCTAHRLLCAKRGCRRIAVTESFTGRFSLCTYLPVSGASPLLLQILGFLDCPQSDYKSHMLWRSFPVPHSRKP